MANYKPDDWYQFLVDQSKTDHIYDLIHNGLPHDFSPDDPIGLVVISPDDMPPGQTAVPLPHLAKTSAAFDENGLMLLRNDCLTDYLEMARSFRVYEGYNSDYVLLSFIPEVWDDEDNFDDDDEDMETENNTGKNSINPADDDPLVQCWNLIVKCENKGQALQLAKQGHALLDQKFPTPETYFKVAAGYNIVATAYVWNNLFAEAVMPDRHYLTIPVCYKPLASGIKPYLELLIAKKQAAYLEQLFAAEALKQHFLPHYEAYISMLVNPHYECSRMFEMINIVNRVNNGLKKYL